jgi:uncharacterized protein
MSNKVRQLTIFISATDLYRRRALYSVLLETLRREGCNGATAVRAITGFGTSRVIHSLAIFRASMNRPIVITVVDQSERIEKVIGPVKEIAPNALIIVQEVQLIQGRTQKSGEDLRQQG